MGDVVNENAIGGSYAVVAVPDANGSTSKARAVVIVGPDGVASSGGDAASSKQDEQTALLSSIDAGVNSAVTELPKQPLLPTSDLTHVRISFNSATDQSIVAGTSGQTIRGHRLRLSVAAACNLDVIDGNSTQTPTVVERIQFPSAGILVLDFDSRPYWITSAAKDLVFKSNVAVQIEGRLGYAKSA